MREESTLDAQVAAHIESLTGQALADHLWAAHTEEFKEAGYTDATDVFNQLIHTGHLEEMHDDDHYAPETDAAGVTTTGLTCEPWLLTVTQQGTNHRIRQHPQTNALELTHENIVPPHRPPKPTSPPTSPPLPPRAVPMPGSREGMAVRVIGFGG